MSSRAKVVSIPSLGFAVRCSLADATRGRVGTHYGSLLSTVSPGIPKGIQLRPPLPWCTFRELLRLEVPSNGERGDTELTRDRSFGDHRAGAPALTASNSAFRFSRECRHCCSYWLSLIRASVRVRERAALFAQLALAHRLALGANLRVLELNPA